MGCECGSKEFKLCSERIITDANIINGDIAAEHTIVKEKVLSVQCVKCGRFIYKRTRENKALKAAKEVLAKHTGGDVLTIEESKILFAYCFKVGCKNCQLKKGGKCPIIIGINE